MLDKKEERRKMFTEFMEEHLTLKGIPEAIEFEPKGYRDVIWCDYLNEPAILEYIVDDITEEKAPNCPNCNRNYEPSTHPFIAHILKPYQFIKEK